jgi:hypothetical protein
MVHAGAMAAVRPPAIAAPLLECSLLRVLRPPPSHPVDQRLDPAVPWDFSHGALGEILGLVQAPVEHLDRRELQPLYFG